MSILDRELSDLVSEASYDKYSTGNRLKTTDFVCKDPEDIVQATGLSYKEVVSVRNVILARHGSVPVNGKDLYSSVVASASILSTGIGSLDDVLCGGLYTGEVTEVVGGVGAGKTQVCLRSALTTAQVANQNVAYIDTGGAFSARQLGEWLEGCHQEKQAEILSRIHVYDATSIYDLFAVLEEIKVHVQSGADGFYGGLKLLVVDCVAAVVYPMLGGGTFVDNQGMLSCLGQKLKQTAVELSLAVLVTNNVVTSDQGMVTASLGRLWSHVPHIRLRIEDRSEGTRQGQRTAVVMKNTRGPTLVTGRFSIPGDEEKT